MLHSRFKKNSIIVYVYTLLCIVFSFGIINAEKLYFSNTSLNVRLYCETGSTNIMISGTSYNGFAFDILHNSSLKYDGTWAGLSSPLLEGTITKNLCSSIVNCMRFNTSPLAYNTEGVKVGGTFFVTNSGYVRNRVIVPNQNTTPPSSQVSRYGDSTNYFTESGSLNVDFYPFPCYPDNAAPTFGFTGMTPHLGGYTGAQFNDRTYVFNLTDMGGINDYGFYTGYNGDLWDVDWTGGSNYSTSASVLNGSGIDLSSFVLQIGVEDSPDSNTFSVVTLTGSLNYTGGSSITGSNPDLVFYPYGFIWNRWNRNYTGYALTGILSSNETIHAIDNKLMFGDRPEEEVIMTGIIVDRAGRTGTFTRHFNYGAIPWSSNIKSGGLVTNCGASNSPYLGLSAGSDSGAYITKYNDGFVVEPFKVYLHDDWAGIDTGTIVVVMTGMQGGSQFVVTLDVTDPEITINPFTWNGPISIATAGNGTKSVYNTTNQSRNYDVNINYTGKRDPETNIQISINYKDLVARTGTQVSCSYFNSYAPYANNWTGGVQLNRYPYASGARLSGFQIKLEDERAGVDSGSIVLTISGRQVNDVVARTTLELFLSLTGSQLSGWLAQYTTHDSIISGGQEYNYTITVPENAGLSQYFAPEHPVDITISYKDFAGKTQTVNKQYSNLDFNNYGSLYNSDVQTVIYINTNYLLINIRENPFLTTFDSTVNVISTYNEWFDAFPIGTYASTSGNTVFSGLQFGIFDYWAGVDGEYNLVVITGSRRGHSATYVFATDDSTLKTNSIWTDCGSTNVNCLTGTMTKVAEVVTGVDSYDGQHPTITKSTGYKYEVTGHNMYFDYGTYSGNTLLASLYNLNIYGQDMRPDSANSVIWSTGLYLDTLQCRFLDRCSHNQLTFVWGTGNDTVNQNPIAGDNNPFLGSRVSIIGSGVEIYTGTSTVFCSASEGLIDTPITLDFDDVVRLGDTPTSTGYLNVTLKVADGLFELTGDNMDQLIVK